MSMAHQVDKCYQMQLAENICRGAILGTEDFNHCNSDEYWCNSN